MASTPRRRRPPPEPACRTPAGPEPDREARLAELVAVLTGCEKAGALHAIRGNDGQPDALEVVARAMVEVDAPAPERFRVAGFLKEGNLVAHHSLRRWDRLHDEEDRPEDQIFDLRVQRARTRIDLSDPPAPSPAAPTGRGADHADSAATVDR